MVESAPRRIEAVAVYLAVAGPAASLGVILGAAAHSFLPDVSRLGAQALAGSLGLALGLWWCAVVGRRWLREDEEEPRGQPRPHLNSRPRVA